MQDKMKLNPENLKMMVSGLTQVGITTIIEGAAGIGKTEMMKQVVKELDLPARFTSSYVVAEGDTQPIISPNVSDGSSNTDLSSLMKDIISFSEEVDEFNKENETNVKGIFFHDELNILYPEDMKAILHWFNEKAIDIPFDNGKLDLNYDKVHNKKYDISNIVLVSAWNDPDKGFSTANAVDPSMISRLAIFHAIIDKENFQEFALENFDSDVVAFIATNMEKIGGADDDSGEKIPPRILEKISDVMKKAKEKDGALTKGNFGMLRIMLDSLIKSSEITTTFMTSLENKDRIEYQELINMTPEDAKDIAKSSKITTSERVRLITEMLISPKKLTQKQIDTWVSFIDGIQENDSDTALLYAHRANSLLNKYGKHKLNQDYPNAALVTVSEEDDKLSDNHKLITQFVKIFGNMNQTVDLVDNL